MVERMQYVAVNDNVILNIYNILIIFFMGTVRIPSPSSGTLRLEKGRECFNQLKSFDTFLFCCFYYAVHKHAHDKNQYIRLVGVRLSLKHCV